MINQRFSTEFGRLLQQVHKILRILSEQDGLDTFSEFKRAQAEREEAEVKGLVEADSALPNTSERIVSNISVAPPKEGGALVSTGANEEKKSEVSLKDKKKITSELNTSKFVKHDDYFNRNVGCFRIDWVVH